MHWIHTVCAADGSYSMYEVSEDRIASSQSSHSCIYCTVLEFHGIIHVCHLINNVITTIYCLISEEPLPLQTAAV